MPAPPVRKPKPGSKPRPKPASPRSVKKPSPAKVSRLKKSFAIEPWGSEGKGERVLLYAESGMGKTTLASMAPKPVFIGVDDGGGKIVNPKTGDVLRHVPGVEDFYDFRDVLSDASLFVDCETVVVDTITVIQEWAIPYMCSTIKHEKGHMCKSIEGYGYGKGYRHLYDTMYQLLSLLDTLANSGKNIILIAQAQNIHVANAESDDYVKEGPRLYTGSKSIPSVAAAYMEWVDHVCRIGYQGIVVEDKKASGCTDRAIFIDAEPWFYAKSRTINERVISFENPADDSLWGFMFPEGK